MDRNRRTDQWKAQVVNQLVVFRLVYCESFVQNFSRVSVQKLFEEVIEEKLSQVLDRINRIE